MRGIVKSVCVSDVRGVPKGAVDTAVLQVGWGIVGDAHGGNWHRQVSLLSHEKVEEFNRRGGQVAPGAFGENFLVSGIDLRTLPVGTRMVCGGALLEVTQIGKTCHDRCEIYHRVGDCIMPREGVFARVLRGGRVSVGDALTVLHPEAHLRAAVVTLSDKGYAGERPDKSGPLACELLTAAGYEIVSQTILPDDREQIERELIRLCDTLDAALVITTGGTGFSPRDVTPEATRAVAHREAPGIAEAIRGYSMTLTKRAMLSRGASVIRGGTLIVNLPGSPKAVGESLTFILGTLNHGLKVLRDEIFDCTGE